ncbi:MAG: hypothetical protein HC848_09745 [Limnobacter sp.]|nr:hypothetical protein [Limnobacter sp.]
MKILSVIGVALLAGLAGCAMPWPYKQSGKSSQTTSPPEHAANEPKPQILTKLPPNELSVLDPGMQDTPASPEPTSSEKETHLKLIVKMIGQDNAPAALAHLDSYERNGAHLRQPVAACTSLEKSPPIRTGRSRVQQPA